jgi:hypothetical protein
MFCSFCCLAFQAIFTFLYLCILSIYLKLCRRSENQNVFFKRDNFCHKRTTRSLLVKDVHNFSNLYNSKTQIRYLIKISLLECYFLW